MQLRHQGVAEIYSTAREGSPELGFLPILGQEKGNRIGFLPTGPVGNWRFVSLPQGESIWERTSVQIHRAALTRHRNGLMRMIAFWKARTMDVWSC